MRRSRFCNLRWGTLVCAVLTCSLLNAQSKKTQAQNLVDRTTQEHSEISGLELSTTPPGQNKCFTIAATEAKNLGEECDGDEAAALKTLKPFAEHEPDGFDVTAPLHDATGKLIGTLGIDFKPQVRQTETDILKQTAELVREVEQQIPSKAFLFQTVP